MPKNQVISLSEARFNRAYRRLMSDLAAFCQEALEDEPWAYDQFYGDGEEVDEEEGVSFELLDWVAFNYRDWDGETLASEYAVLANDELDDTERTMIQAWQQTHMGLYRVEADEGLEIHLQDWFTGAGYHVLVDSAQDPMDTGDLVICRLLPVGESYRFGYGVLSRPTGDLPSFGPALEQELAHMRRQKPVATWEDLLADRWPLVREILNAEEDELPAHVAASGPASLGHLQPPPGASPFQRQIGEHLASYLEDVEVRSADREAAQRLWWDAAAVLAPSAGKADAWAAGAAYAFLHSVLMGETTQTEVSEAFGVSAASLSGKAKAIGEALGLADLDDRYADALDPRVRIRQRQNQVASRVAVVARQEGAAHLMVGELADRNSRKHLAAPLSPADSLEALLSARSKTTLDRTAAGVSIAQTYRYKKDELCEAIAHRLPAFAGALLKGLPVASRQLVTRLLLDGPLPWAQASAEYKAERHPEAGDNSPLAAAWLAGLVYIGTPGRTNEPIVFVPDALKPHL